VGKKLPVGSWELQYMIVVLEARDRIGGSYSDGEVAFHGAVSGAPTDFIEQFHKKQL
jgi:hypothetical protein